MNKKRVPLVHVTRIKDYPWYKGWIIRILAIIAALVVIGIITMLLTGENPLDIYGTMIYGSFGT